MFSRSFAVGLFALLSSGIAISQQADLKPAKKIRVGVVGLVHDHVHWILGREDRGDIEIVGIAEPNRELAERYAKRHGYRMELVYPTLEEMIQKTKPDAVLVFTSIYDHLSVVEYCAPRHIHVMVEKPMAVNAEHARRMVELAEKNHIYLLTNYETTWYGSNEKAWELIKTKKQIGDIRKIDFYTGHQGPVEIGCSQEFLAWLTDPIKNGAGALTDFGCYGADLATWFMDGEHPISVSAITQQIKPDKYPRVDDEATIVLTYPKAQVIIQASWNWPYGRKEMEVYGQTGYVFCKDGKKMLVRETNSQETKDVQADPLPVSRNDPFAYFAQVINGRLPLSSHDLSAPATNETVVRILEAARHSAKTGQVIKWEEYFSK